MNHDMKVVVLSGGVGGTKLVEGLAGVLDHNHLSVIGNIGDDDEFHGLWVSPDIDIVMYSLANRVNRETGWGFADESFQTLDMLKQLGADVWMTLGDKDFAVHIYRTLQRRLGKRPAKIALEIAAALGVDVPILLPTDDVVTSQILTPEGWLNMEAFFVREGCRPPVHDIHYKGATEATPTQEALAAIAEADVLLIAPSNPLVSIGPTLAIPGIREAIICSDAYRVAVSPFIAGNAIKGPACEMMTASGYRPNVFGIADFYKGLIDGLVVDSQDAETYDALQQTGLDVGVQNTLMQTETDKVDVARTLMEFITVQTSGDKRYAA